VNSGGTLRLTDLCKANNLTNRYASVGESGLEYDAAGNLTKDRLGYGYSYDYENRIAEINDVNGTVVAEFAYDALGRRIRKIDIERVIKPYFYCGRLQKPAPAFSVSNVLDDPLEGSPPGICRLRPWRRLFRSTS